MLGWLFKADSKEKSMTNSDGVLNLMNDLTTLLQDRGFAPAYSRSMTSAVALQQWRYSSGVSNLSVTVDVHT